MQIAIAVFGGLVGWSVAPPTWLIAPPIPRPPGPKESFIGFIGGVVGALLVQWMFSFEAAPSATELIVVSIGAFAFSRALASIVSWISPDKSPM